jgi:glycosyltransferase involved in cell wall biosynthesis
MRILIASDLHWPTINGIATFGQNLAHGLAAVGHDVVVIAPSQTGTSYEEIDRNHRVVRTRSVVFSPYQNLRISVSPKREIAQIVEAFGPDVIHVQTPLGIGLGAIAAARKCDVPLVATNHSMSENFIDNIKPLAPLAKPTDAVLRRYGRWFYLHADHVTMPTQAAMNMLKPDDFRKPTSVISNGIDLSRFHPGEAPEDLRERFGIPQHVPVVLYVGRLDAEKHLSVLVRAARKMLEGGAFHLVIVGIGIDRDHLEHLTNDLDIQEHVTFTGRVDEEDKPGFFRMATVFAMPSPAELQSISTLEAMASGLPVVAVDAGALGELCEDGHNGLLFDLDDTDGLGRGLARILDDPDLAGSMGTASLGIAARHDLRETISQFVALYERVAAAPHDW